MSSTAPENHEATSYRLVFGALALAVFAGAASMRILDALLPTIAHQSGRSIGTTSMAVTGYALSYSGCQLFYGPLGDRLGPYRLISWTALLSAAAALTCAAAPSLAWLIVFRVIAGGIAAGIGPLALTWVGHATSLAERPLIIARNSSASILGATVGQIGSGIIRQFDHWRSVFLLCALLFAIAGVALAWMGGRFSDIKDVGRVIDLQRGESMARRLLTRPVVIRTLSWVALEGLAVYMTLTYASSMLQRRLSIDIADAGLVVSLFGIGGVAFALLASHVLKWWSSAHRAALGGVLAAVGFGLLLLVQMPLSAAACMFCAGFGFFALHNVLQVLATHMAPDAPGAAVSLFAATFFLAQAVGGAIGGWSFDHIGRGASCGASAAILLGLGLSVSSATRMDRGRSLQARLYRRSL